METSSVAITYGRTTDNEIRTFFVETVEEARGLAKEFCSVIPDDIDDYLKDIRKWKGSAALVFTHQDDDTFFFSAAPLSGVFGVTEPEGLVAFREFVAAYIVNEST